MLLGFLFGLALQYARLNEFNTISGMAVRKDFTVAKTIAAVIGTGVIGLAFLTGLGYAGFYIKPFIAGSIILGGLLFGTGMAILGYCPGTLPVSMGQGSLDAFLGFAGGLLAGWIYTLLSPYIHNTIGPDLGPLALTSLADAGTRQYYWLVSLIGLFFVSLAFVLNRWEKKKDYRWFVSALGITAVTLLIFVYSKRVLGASTFYPYLADVLTGTTANEYFIKQVARSGNYEMKFLAGTFLSGFVISLLRGEFRFRLLHQNWIRYKGHSVKGRIGWSLAGGFLLIMGARLAGGCTSGHIISGGVQLAAGSLVFAFIVFAAFLTTGSFFYRRAGNI